MQGTDELEERTDEQLSERIEKKIAVAKVQQ